MDDRLYFRQLQSGVDYGCDDMVAHQMANFAYLIGDRTSGEAVIVDPAYDVDGLLDILEADQMRCVGAVATHYHADHIGGSMMGFNLGGIAELTARIDVPIHLQQPEIEFVTKTTGVSASQLNSHSPGDTIQVGAVDLTLIHTPGHTPGSQCVLVDDRLITGDTLFLNGCGRTDLPGGDPAELYRSLTSRLSAVPDHVELFCGHNYGTIPSQPMGDTRHSNAVFGPRTEAEWLRLFG